MKKLILALICATAAISQLCADDVVLTTLFSDGTTNTWTQADLVAALQLLNRKYHREVNTSEGRRAWHGRLVSTAIDTNTLTRTTVYEDGTTFTDEAAVTTPKQAAAAYSAALPPPVMTNGIPARLAAARVRQARDAATTNIVTVTIGK